MKDLKRQYDPTKDKNATSDPNKTLFVSRLNFKTDEETLKREFERFGPINSLRLVRDAKTGKSKGYAFVEFKHSRHCERLYDSNGMKIDGKKILVDYECSRTVEDWLPKRLGGGKGNKRRDRDTEHKIRKVIKEYKAKLQEAKKAAKAEEKQKQAPPELEVSHKRQKIDENSEVELKPSKSESQVPPKAPEPVQEQKIVVNEPVAAIVPPTPEVKLEPEVKEAKINGNHQLSIRI